MSRHARPTPFRRTSAPLAALGVALALAAPAVGLAADPTVLPPPPAAAAPRPAAPEGRPKPLTPLATAVETTAGALLWPTSLPGTLVVQGCRECPTLEVTATTAFVARGRAITLAEARAYATAQPPMLPATVLFDPKTRAAVRVHLQ
jgi:hypothetical protein